MAKHKYPIGIQAFDKIRSDNFLYIDKTELIYNLAHGNSQYVFLLSPEVRQVAPCQYHALLL